MDVEIVEGDLLDQDIEAIVNAWNRNIIPWWLLLPQGVSGAIKRKAGLQPFRELARHGSITLGGAVATSAGQLSYRWIIHVAGTNLFWRASQSSITNSVRNAMNLAETLQIQSIAFPIIGAGSGGFSSLRAEQTMLETFKERNSSVLVRLVRYRKPTSPRSRGDS